MDRQDLAQRYGAPSPARRRVVVAVTAAVAAVALGWLAWAAWVHGTPEVTSELVGFEVVDDHQAIARVDVTMDAEVDATCLVRASALDHTVVGELSFAAVPGRNEVAVRTERRATAVERIGCTAPGQTRPR